MNSFEAEYPSESNGALGRIRGAIEKHFTKIHLARVQVASKLNLNHLPNYVSYQAALAREKLLFQHISLALVALFVIMFIYSRVEVATLEDKLRRKEYILAPGVSDFIPVAPQSVPDSYVQNAVSDYVATLGNTNPVNIEERFRQLSNSMSKALQVEFMGEASAWISKAKRDNVSEILTITGKTITADDQGNYKAKVKVKVETFVNSQNIGFRNEVIEMALKLVPPDANRRWYLEITALSRTNAEAFDVQQSLGGNHD